MIRPEILDDLPLEQKRGSLADLDRLNRQSGLRGLRELMTAAAPPPEFSMLDVGAASGLPGRYIADWYPGASVTSLDYRHEHLPRIEGRRVVANAFALPFRDGAYDYVFSSLFLHHFEDEAVVRLLAEMGRVARRAVLALDLRRHPLAYWFVPATRLLYGWDPITIHDAPISVAAAFHPAELEDLARRAGLEQPVARGHGLSFRVSLLGRSRGRSYLR